MTGEVSLECESGDRVMRCSHARYDESGDSDEKLLYLVRILYILSVVADIARCVQKPFVAYEYVHQPAVNKN